MTAPKTPHDRKRAALSAWADAETAAKRAAIGVALEVSHWAQTNGFTLPDDLRASVAEFDRLWAANLAANAAWVAARDAMNAEANS